MSHNDGIRGKLSWWGLTTYVYVLILHWVSPYPFRLHQHTRTFIVTPKSCTSWMTQASNQVTPMHWSEVDLVKVAQRQHPVFIDLAALV
jgi:hypothetical protein